MTDEDPLIAALEARVNAARSAENARAKRETTTDLYAADCRWYSRGIKGSLFFYTFEPVAFDRGATELVGYASGIMRRSGGSNTYEIDIPSVGIHRTRREAKQRAWDIYQGARLMKGLRNRWGAWNEPKRKEGATSGS